MIGKTGLSAAPNPPTEHESAHLRALIECSPDLIWSVDLEYRLVTFNKALADVIKKNWGVTARPRMKPRDFAPPEIADAWIPMYEKALESGPYRLEYPQSSGGWVELSFNPIEMDGGLAGVSVFAKEITEQKLAEDRVRASEERLRSFFDLQLVGMLVTSPQKGFLEVNDRACQLLGYPREELLKRTWVELTHPDDLEKNLVLFRQMESGQIDRFSLEKRFIRQDGRLIWIMISVGCVRAPDGSVDHVCTILEDISERKAAEEAIEKAEREYRRIFEQAPEGIFKTEVGGKALSLNPAGASMLGYASSEEAIHLIQDTAHQVWLNPEDRAEYVSQLETFGEIHNRQFQFKRKDGTPIWVSMTARRLIGDDGVTPCYQGSFENLSEKKRLEAELSEHLREVKLLNEMNEALLRARSENELLEDYCRIIVETGGYRMAWVGFAEHEPEKRIVPVAWFGHEDGYLSEVKFAWDGGMWSKGPTGRAVISGQIEVAQDFEADPGLKPFYAAAVQRGFKSMMAVPFRVSANSMACLTAYGATRNSWSESERRLMDHVASALGYGINTLRTSMAKDQYQRDLRASLEQTIQVIAETVDQRDPYTAGHQRRVADLCTHIARKMRLDEDRVHGLHLAASIHDVGKMSIPAEFLTKPGKLTPVQYTLVKEHAEMGYEIVRGVQFPWPIADIVRQHHERMDGSGYPQGLQGDEILLEARILAVADVVEAMAMTRPYRESLGVEIALGQIISGRGTLYDEAVVNACVWAFREHGYRFPA